MPSSASPGTSRGFCWPVVVWPCGLFWHGGLCLDHCATAPGLVALAGAAGGRAGGCGGGRGDRRAVVPGWAQRLLLCPDHPGLCRGAAHRHQLGQLHRRWPGHADSNEGQCSQFPVCRAQRFLFFDSRAGRAVSGAGRVAAPLALWRAVGRHPRKRRLGQGPGYQCVSRKGQGDAALGRHWRHGRLLFCPVFPLHRSAGGVWCGQIGRDAASQHDWRGRYGVWPAGRGAAARLHQRHHPGADPGAGPVAGALWRPVGGDHRLPAQRIDRPVQAPAQASRGQP